MEKYDVVIKGITPENRIAKYIKSIPKVEKWESNTLKISNEVFDIDRIEKIEIKIGVKSINKDELHRGCNLNIEAYKDIEVSYISLKSDKRHHKLYYKIPFYGQIYYDSKNIIAKTAYVALENVDIKIVNKREFILKTKTLVAPIPK